ncbi:MAG: alkaline phosphatase family protein [Alphaproteobacteria bacterium]|nr:alkaline phosphatase family protein [Alphaproteobacteria bacterium]
MRILRRSVALAAGLLAASIGLSAYADGGYGGNGVKRVLLISIDGMHALDFINCAQGVSGVNGGAPYCPNLAGLAETGVNYLEAATAEPSDSFPGLMALVTGGSPRTVGAFYDVAYDYSLDPPAKTTGNGVSGDPSLCKAGQPPMGTRTEFDEGIDFDQTQLNGGAPGGADGGIASIDPQRLERDPAHDCNPVYPWNFVRTNTIFGVIHDAHGYTAWSDKHPSYSSVSGPGKGTNVDDYYSPEINSIPVNLPQVKILNLNCNPLPDQTAVSSSNDWTNSFQNIQCYDALKVQAILNEINGKDHSGQFRRPVPNIFGMNFQVVSIGQKLIEKSLTPTVTGGYMDNEGRPTSALLGEIEFADAAIGKMVTALKTQGLYNSTLIIISAKHGQSPIDSARYLGISNKPNDPITTSPAGILDALLPPSEQPFPPGNPSGDPPQIGPTEDDISLLWLADPSQTANAVKMLESQSPAAPNSGAPAGNKAGIGEIYSGPGITQMFNPPGLPPNGDPRTPQIIVTPNIGVTYSGSGKKLAEHGGFAHDDINAILLVSNPSISSSTVTSPVENYQVAPTILAALGLDPNKLDSVRLENVQVLPGLGLDSGKSGY